MIYRGGICLLLISICGCGWHAQTTSPYVTGSHAAPVAPLVENPLLVPSADREFLWDQIVDEIDNYFRIQSEQRVRQAGNVLIEGRIDTFPTIGSTYLEPWRRDSTHGFEKLHSTLQTIRRRAEVRVVPTGGGFLLDVAVFKELEDLAKPEQSSVGYSTLRNDDALDSNLDDITTSPATLGWIPLGRDASLEQRILANLRHRLGDPTIATEPLPPPAIAEPIGLP